MKSKEYLLKIGILAYMLICQVIMAMAYGTLPKEAAKPMAEVDGLMGDLKWGVPLVIKAISGVLVFIGCFKVYWKFIMGDRDVTKTIIMVVGGCIALVAALAIIPQIFKYNKL